jgi:predicted metal-dependent peptidase
MTRNAADQGPLGPWLKPGTLEDAPSTDKPESVEEAVKAVASGRRFTYRRLMAEKGVEPGEPRHQRSFEWALMWLRENRPFYAYCFAEIVRRETYEIPTLAVGVRNGRVEMVYNPDFMAIHNLKHNVGFLQHEIGHCVHGHVEEGRKKRDLHRDPLVNVAMDLAVDSLIQSEGDQPGWVLMPSKLRIPEEGKAERDWKNFPERETWERYYELLQQIREKSPQYFKKISVKIMMSRPKGDDPGSGKPGDSEPGDDGEPGDGKDGKGKKPGDGKGGEGEPGEDGKPGKGREPGDEEGDGGGELQSFDDHGQWGGVNDSPEVVHEAVKAMVRHAYQTAQSRGEGGKMRGYMPGDLLTMIDEIMREKSVPFEKLLRMFVARHVHVTRRSTVAKVNRKTHVPPGSKRNRRLSMLWCRDTSGSVSDEELAVSYNELFHMTRLSHVQVQVQDFDHGLHGPPIAINRSTVKRAAEFKGRGGTDFAAPLALAEEMRPDVCIVTTDGYAPFPKPPRGVPVIWLITHDGALPPWGMVVRLPSKADIAIGHKAVVERWLGQK